MAKNRYEIGLDDTMIDRYSSRRKAQHDAESIAKRDKRMGGPGKVWLYDLEPGAGCNPCSLYDAGRGRWGPGET